jgi:pimeloyl-ACP methyl ester carboxylesterase
MTKTLATPPLHRPLWQRLLLRRLKFLTILAALAIVVLGGSYLFAPQWLMQADHWRKAAQAHVEKHQLIAGDTTWSYYEGGDGPVLVLLHGYGTDKNVWLDVAAQLTAHFHVIIPDLPGWGESSPASDGGYTVDAQAQRLQSFVQAKGLNGFVLVGHSMGGAIAGVYAAEHPEHVAGLALLDALGLKSKDTAFTQATQAGTNPFVYDDRAGFEKAQALIFSKPPSVPGRLIDVLVQRNQRNRDLLNKTFAALRDPAQRLAVQNRLGELNMPVLGLWCLNDKVTDISAQDSLRNGLAHSRSISTTTLIGCDHMPMLEKPEETARVLANFTLAH